MQPLRANREPIYELATRGQAGDGGSTVTARTEIASLFSNDYSNSQRRCMFFFL